MTEQQQNAGSTEGEFYAEPYEPMEMGPYEATVKRIVKPDKEGPFGPQYEWYFNVEDEEYQGQEIKAFSSQAFSPNAKARAWVNAILGREVQEGERFGFKDLIGKKVIVHIGHNKTDRGTFEKVEGLSPVRRKRRGEQAQKQQETAPAEAEPEATDADADDGDVPAPPF